MKINARENRLTIRSFLINSERQERNAIIKKNTDKKSTHLNKKKVKAKKSGVKPKKKSAAKKSKVKRAKAKTKARPKKAMARKGSKKTKARKAVKRKARSKLKLKAEPTKTRSPRVKTSQSLMFDPLEQVTVKCSNCGREFNIVKLQGLSTEGMICQRCAVGEIEFPE